MKLFRFEVLRNTRGGHPGFASQINIPILVMSRVTDDNLIRLSPYHFSLRVGTQTGDNTPTQRKKSRKRFR